MSAPVYLDSVKKMPLMSLPVRSVFISLNDNGVLISPGSGLNPAALNTLSGVTDLVAPSLLHCGGIPGAATVFPQARVWGPRRAREKKPAIPWTNVLSPRAWPYQEDLPLVQIEGTKTEECAFVHKESKTLILCDLAFNLRDPKGFGAWLILHMFGTYRRFAISRFFMKMTSDRAAFERSMKEILSYDFDQISVSHGDHVSSGGKKLLRRALENQGFNL